MIKEVLTKKFLEEHYIRQNKSVRVITEETGIPKTSVFRALDFHGIPKKSGRPLIALTKERLWELYVIQEKPMKQIAKELGVRSATSIKKAPKRFGIKSWPHGWISKTKRESHRPNDKSCYDGEEFVCGSYWSIARSHANMRKMAFEITIKYALEIFQKQKGLCALSGVPIKMAKRVDVLKDKDAKTASLDRIDSTRGYVVGNIQWIHKDLQRMKLDMPEEKFIRWCHLISDNQRNKE